MFVLQVIKLLTLSIFIVSGIQTEIKVSTDPFLEFLCSSSWQSNGGLFYVISAPTVKLALLVLFRKILRQTWTIIAPCEPRSSD